jgi:hypothetical protein
MNSPASNDVGPTDHVTVVRFVVPDSLLVALLASLLRSRRFLMGQTSLPWRKRVFRR